MYNLDGIFYQMQRLSMVYITVMLIFLISSRFWVKEKRKAKELVLGIVCMFLAIGTITYYLYVIRNPKISIHEGFFIEEHRENRSVTRWEYVFTNDKGLKPVFYLDISSKKNIYPDDFETKNKYRIYFEERTDIIVKVELLE